MNASNTAKWEIMTTKFASKYVAAYLNICDPEFSGRLNFREKKTFNFMAFLF